jgi:hypothetical protein
MVGGGRWRAGASQRPTLVALETVLAGQEQRAVHGTLGGVRPGLHGGGRGR